MFNDAAPSTEFADCLFASVQSSFNDGHATIAQCEVAVPASVARLGLGQPVSNREIVAVGFKRLGQLP